jgi:hypothetical protein
MYITILCLISILASTYICTVLSSEERMNVKHTQHTVRNVRRAIVRLLLQTTARKIPPLVPYGIVRRTVRTFTNTGTVVESCDRGEDRVIHKPTMTITMANINSKRSIRTTATVVEEVCTDPVISTRRQRTTIAGRINALEMFFLGVLHNDLGYSSRISLIEQTVGLSSSHPLNTHRGLDVLETARQRIHFLERCVIGCQPPLGTGALIILDSLECMLLRDGINVGKSIFDRIERLELELWGDNNDGGESFSPRVLIQKS